MNANLRNFALWVIIVLLLLALFTLFQNPGQHTTSQDISFSELLTDVDSGRVKDVLIQGPEIHGTFTDGRTFQTYSPSDPTLIQRLYNKGVSITAHPQSDNLSWFVSPLISWLPFVALIGVCIFLSRQMQGIAKLLTEAHGRDERQNPICQEIDLPRTIKDLLAQTKSNLATLESGGLLQWADNTDAASAWFKRNIVMYEAILERFAKQSGRE